MHARAKPWQVAHAALVLTTAIAIYGWIALQPRPIRVRAEMGDRPTYYEAEFGTPPGLLDELKRTGHVPPDAIDDGKGHFLSPSRLTPAELEYARQIQERRLTRRGNAPRR